MSRLAPAIIILSFAVVTGALAQTGGNSTGTGGVRTTPLPAPVGHRQPTRSDVAPAAPGSNPNDADDKALDRKIKSICRGC
ncbi:MAG: hypothetical protein ACLP8B_07760 [Xanthobacteraceae bacterium]